MFACAQTFLLDPSVVRGALEAYLTGVDLYFKSKPKETNNRSGIVSPGVEVRVVGTTNRVPNTSELANAPVARREYGEVVASADASAATGFTFPRPLRLTSSREYAIVVKFDGDEDFVLWTSVQGDVIVGTNRVSPGPSGGNVGNYYDFTAGSEWKPRSGVDLTMRVRFARFGANGASVEYRLPVRNYEFLAYDRSTATGNFHGGERVFVNATPESGTLIVSSSSREVTVNTGVDFTLSLSGSGDEWLVLSNGTVSDVRRVVSIDSNTRVTVDDYPSFACTSATWYLSPVATVFSVDATVSTGVVQNVLVLVDSTANATSRFEDGDDVVGEVSGAKVSNVSVLNVEAQTVLPDVVVDAPAGTSVRLYHSTAYYAGGGNTANVQTLSTPTNTLIRSGESNPIRLPNAVLIPSRSNEVAHEANAATSSLSSVITVSATSNNEFVVPVVDPSRTDVFVSRFLINSDYTGEEGRYGNALSKHLTTRVSFAEGRLAEDVRVYLRAYKPAGTDIKVYAKIHSSEDPEPFDDRDWTLLELKEGIGVDSSSSDPGDFIELGYGFPLYPNSAVTLDGTVTTAQGNVEVVGVGTSFDTELEVNDVVKVHQRLFSNDYVIGVVNSVTNATHFTLNEPITNVNVVGSGLLVDRIAFPHQAFNYQPNENVVRYYNQGMVEYDGYDTAAVKIVLLADSSSLVPRVDDVRFVAVSS